MVAVDIFQKLIRGISGSSNAEESDEDTSGYKETDDPLLVPDLL